MKNNNEKNQVIIQGSILAVASLVVRMIGLLYRIPMTRIIGETGIGYYSTAFQVYNVILLLSSYSMPQALSKLMAARLGKRQFRNANRYFLCCFSVSVLSGAIFASIMYWGSGYIAGTLLHAQLAEYSLRVLAPTVFVMSFLGVFRGYFQGFNNMLPTAISQIIEQIINAIVSVVAAYILFAKGMKVDLVKGTTEYAGALGAKGGTYGTLFGAVAALIFMAFVFVMVYGELRSKMRKEPENRVFAYKRVYSEIYAMILPIVISTFIFHILNLIDNGIYNRYMVGTGIDEKTYMAIWGVYSGKYQLLVNLPIALATAMSSSVIPQLTKAVALRDKADVHQKIDMSLHFTTYITIPAMIGLAVLGSDLIKLLFGNGQSAADGGKMMVVGCLAVLFYAYATISNGILHGLGRMFETVKNALIGLIIHLIVLALLLWVFKAGITGVVIAYMVFAFVVSVLNHISIYSYTGFKGNYMKLYAMPLLASIVMGIIVYGINFAVKLGLIYVIHSETISSLFSIVLSVSAGIIVYFMASIVFGAVNEADLLDMPMGGRLVKLGHKLHVL